MQEMQVWSLSRADLPEKEMATHSTILAWKIPWTEEPCRLQSMGSQSRTWLSNWAHMKISTFSFLSGFWVLPTGFCAHLPGTSFERHGSEGPLPPCGFAQCVRFRTFWMWLCFWLGAWTQLLTSWRRESVQMRELARHTSYQAFALGLPGSPSVSPCR